MTYLVVQDGETIKLIDNKEIVFDTIEQVSAHFVENAFSTNKSTIDTTQINLVVEAKILFASFILGIN